MNVRVEYEKDAAVRVAEYLESVGMNKAAADTWLAIGASNPYELRPREKLADLLFDPPQCAHPLGSVERSRLILKVLGITYPTEKLTQGYFDNLRQLLRSKRKRSKPGPLVLGVGSGRCGSTTLAAAFGAVPDSCATHEVPPAVFWQQDERIVRFHVDRFRLLAEYHAVVFDAAHWWLNALPRIFAEFPDSKAVGLVRETQACVRSFLSIKGKGPGTLNHWAVHGNGIWATSPGDPTYPSYRVPTNLVADPDAAKTAHIERYVTEYNQKLDSLAAEFPGRILVVRTEELSDADTEARISQFVGIEITMPKTSLNVGGNADSDRMHHAM